ncbi:scabin-related ADP-ribosyltransferase [Vibrio brasiliensis]
MCCVLHRGDTRPPEQIFEEGFAPKDPNANVDLETYVNSEPSPPSQYVK